VRFDELFGVFLDFSFVLLEFIGDLIVHRDLPHFGFRVEFDVLFPLSVEVVNFCSNLVKSVFHVLINNSFDIKLEILESVIHFPKLAADIILQVF
jgi:hypothetical protein